MLQKTIEWFNNLSNADKIAIVVPVGLAFLGVLFAFLKWLFSKKTDPPIKQRSIEQNGNKNKAIIADGNKGNIAGGDIHTGIESEAVLTSIVEISTKLGRTEKENEQLRGTIKQLEEKLAQPVLETNITSEKSTPVPSSEAKELAKLITEYDGPYAQALKAISEGNSEQADKFLDETQQILDSVRQAKDSAQVQIYLARIQNASYAGKPQDALPYCNQLLPIARDDSLIINEIAEVYYYNALYHNAEPLMRRALEIDEKSFGKDHPDVARDLNNLAQLLKDTNRLKEAEPLMRRALEIDEKSFGKDHPDVARDLNNLAQLLQATNRLKEAEPLYLRVVEIFEKSLGPEHPNVATALNNLAALLQATNRLKEAEPLMRRVVEIYEKSLGPEHPNVATVRLNLELLLLD
jgi:tetratricopeptide (TPR) repeat protein